MIYSQPGASFEATITGAPTGLTGTIGVRILDNLGATTLARRTEGIVESPSGSGFYTVTLTAPTSAGQYTVFWDNGSVGPATTSTDDLVVTSTSASVSPPSGSDLTTLANVRSFLQKQTADTGQDAVIEAMISQASTAIARFTQRQFVEEASATKVFEVNQPLGTVVNFAPYELQSVTTIELDTDTSTPTTLEAEEFRLWPKPNPDGTYFGVRLNPYRSLGAVNIRWGARREMSVKGKWGLPAIPADIVHWANVTVAIWLRRDVAAFETAMNLEDNYLERPAMLPTAVMSGLAQYKRMVGP